VSEDQVQVPPICECNDPVICGITSTNGSISQQGTNQFTVELPAGFGTTLEVVSCSGTSPYTYSWNTVPVVTSSSVTVNAGVTKTYVCNIQDDQGCVGAVSISVQAANCALLDFEYTVNGVANPSSVTLIGEHLWW
jgi:hypothetical protein